MFAFKNGVFCKHFCLFLIEMGSFWNTIEYRKNHLRRLSSTVRKTVNKCSSAVYNTKWESEEVPACWGQPSELLTFILISCWCSSRCFQTIVVHIETCCFKVFVLKWSNISLLTVRTGRAPPVEPSLTHNLHCLCCDAFRVLTVSFLSYSGPVEKGSPKKARRGDQALLFNGERR